MELYFDREQREKILTTPFVRSWIGLARPGDLGDPNFDQRVAAWAAWAAEALVGVKGYRDYPALALPGKFYDPKGTGEMKALPHLEISAAKMQQADPEFPKRLALAGNGLHFPWWVYPEVVATKRALFGGPGGSIEGLVDLLVPRSQSLRDGLTLLRDACRPQWSTVEELLVTSSGDGLVGDACGDFDVAEVDAYLPGARQLQLRVVFEEKLREKSGVWAARRVGVWQLVGESGGEEFSTPVITPRLTANSTLNDPMFTPETEGLAALLVRALVLRRIARKHLSIQPQVQNHRIGVPAPTFTSAVEQKPASKVAHLRGIVAAIGEKTPEGSTQAAVGFLQAHDSAEEAWKALVDWAGHNRTLTVSRETFLNAFRNAKLAVRRAEEPERDDINLILPLAWDEKGRVVRATFYRGSTEA